MRSSSTVQLAALVSVSAEVYLAHLGVSLIARAVEHCHRAEAASGVLWCESQAALPEPLGLPWPHHGTAELGCPSLAAVGEALAGFAFQGSTLKRAQMSPRTRLSSDFPAPCGEKPVLVVGGPA